MKRLSFVLALFSIIGICSPLAVHYFTEKKENTVYIALAGPMSGSSQEEGKAMLRGVTLAYERIKSEGNILKGKNIKILPYNDQTSQTAVRIASDIVNEDKVLLVLGHYSSSGSAAAGPIYLRGGIPAITASAAVDSVTMDNDWFFRTIPGDHAMTAFVVQSIRQLFGATSTTASMIYDAHYYETTAREFKEQTENIFDTLRTWSFDSNSDKKENDLKKILGEIRAEKSDSIGPIFFATGSQDCARLISGFRYPGTNYPIIGLSSLSIPSFIEQFNSSSAKKETAGYYTDGTYAVSPFISYLADQPNARSFREKFFRMFGREPLRWAATYYDAMLVALNAIEKAEVQGENIREDRRRVRDALSNINEKDVAVNGVTGDIYFDEDGNVNLPLALGVWRNHEFIPAYQQYQGNLNEQETQENDASPIIPLKVVYAGIDMNTVHNITFQKVETDTTRHADSDLIIFTADFYIWFRFKGSLDDRAIEFTNAVKPVSLGAPIMEETDEQGVTVRSYRVIADFKVASTPLAYPLDRHALRISFHHKKETRDTLIYVPDVIGTTGSASQKNRGETLLEKIPAWKISEIFSKQNIRILEGSDEKKISSSGIDTEINIQREGRGFLSIKIFFPFLIIITCCYLLFFLPPEKIRLRMYCLLLFLLLIAGIRILYEHILPGWEITHYMLYLVATLILFSALVFGCTYRAHQRHRIQAAQCILYTGSFLYLTVVSIGGGLLLYVYLLRPNQDLINQIASLVTYLKP